jgi:RNA polymerase sigma factor (sigma-70 family)
MEHTEPGRQGAVTGMGDETTDGALLERVATRREEAAFAALVQRYGPLVLAVCRRVLHHEQDAEDAFQATFLVLFHKAGSIGKRAAVGSWLYSVAYRTARKARGRGARRQVREAELSDVPAAEASPEWLGREVRAVLDEEVNRLPAKYRLPLVLCYFEGKTNEQAARLLGCPLGTVLSRLARARDRLRGRLTRRGLAFPAALVAVILAERAALADVPALLVDATVRSAALFGGGRAAAPGATSGRAAALARGVLREQLLAKLTKFVAGLLVLAGLLAVCLLLLLPAKKPKTDQVLLQGTWAATAVWAGQQPLPPAGVRFTFTGDRCTASFGNATLPTTYRLESTKDPKEIDFGVVRGGSLPGIYRLDGDRLQLCLNMGGPERPTDLAKQPDPRLFLYEFRREGAAQGAGETRPEGKGP